MREAFPPPPNFFCYLPLENTQDIALLFPNEENKQVKRQLSRYIFFCFFFTKNKPFFFEKLNKKARTRKKQQQQQNRR